MNKTEQIEDLTRQVACSYEQSPDFFEIYEDYPNLQNHSQREFLTSDYSLNVRYFPYTIEYAASSILDEIGLQADIRLQALVARLAIKLIMDYEVVKKRRQRIADRLNNPIH